VEKDPDVLVEAFQRAHDAVGNQALFGIAGDGPRAPALSRALPFARHFGFLARDVLADLYADADLFVFPSPTETCGLVTLEAMASGLPVISADRGGVLENMRDGINGLVAAAGSGRSFAEATVALVGDVQQRIAMGQAARAFAVGRDWTREMGELERMYQEVMSAWRLPKPDALREPVGAVAAGALPDRTTAKTR
jgi:glycosyltransferase involved in cell wall biosynthesis